MIGPAVLGILRDSRVVSLDCQQSDDPIFCVMLVAFKTKAARAKPGC